MTESAVNKDTFLAELGARLKRIRREKKLSRRHIAEISDVSQRFLSQFEAGEGNISVARLHSLCEALEVPLHSVLAEQSSGDNTYHATSDRDSRVPHIQAAIAQASPEQLDAVINLLGLSVARQPSREKIALIGLRGAGKSTLAALLATDLEYELVEVDSVVEKTAGLGLAEVFSLYGQEGYLNLVREALEKIAARSGKVVITTGGSIVSDATTYRYLLNQFLTVWISTSPEEHISRVLAQGDERPLAGDKSPMHSLKHILEQRTPLYALAPLSIDTSRKNPHQSAEELKRAVLAF